MITPALQDHLADLFPDSTPSPAQVQQAFAALAAETVTTVVRTDFDNRGLASLFGPFVGPAIIDKLRELAAGDPEADPRVPAIKLAVEWLNSPAGINLGDPSVRLMLDALSDVFTPEQSATLKRLAETDFPKWPGLALADLEAYYRPTWEAAYAAEQDAIQARAVQIMAADDQLNERESRDTAAAQLQQEGLIRG